MNQYKLKTIYLERIFKRKIKRYSKKQNDPENRAAILKSKYNHMFHLIKMLAHFSSTQRTLYNLEL